jgi:long-chain fatty acid transport protein
MRKVDWKTCRSIVSTLTIVLLGAVPARAQIGDGLAGIGPINRSMGGAAVAAPIDAAGALFWNPASIAGLTNSELESGLELLFPRTWISSRVAANALRPGLPPQSMYGNTGANNGVQPLPFLGLTYRSESNPFWTYGVGIFPLSGFSVNYPAVRTNPILQPQAPFGLGFGPLYSSYQLLQLAPTIACQITENLAIGAAANLDLGSLSANPGVFGAPTLVSTPIPNLPGLNYPSATDGRFRWGGGFSVGAYYDAGTNWKFGASVKSPQWFDTYTFNAVTANGHIVRPKVDVDFPMIASVGTAYTGIERLLFALDLRFADFRDTNGFRHSGFNPNGSVAGLGWQNLFALGTGVQYQFTDALSLRAGYTFSMNPAGNSVAVFSLLAPTIVQHSVAAGLSYNLTKSCKLSLAYVHFFENSIQGPIITPLTGPIRGSEVRTSATADAVLLGATVSF